MSEDQSKLTSLASLLESAEARVSSLPPPPVSSATSDSGLIDLKAMEARARAQRENAARLATRPTPIVMSMPTGDADRSTPATVTADPDLVLVIEQAKRRRKQMILGGSIGGAVLLLLAIVAAIPSGDSPAATAAAAAQSIPVATPKPVDPPPPVVAPTPTPQPAPVLAAAAPADDAPAAPAHAKKHKAHKAKSKGPALTKVQSTGI